MRLRTFIQFLSFAISLNFGGGRVLLSRMFPIIKPAFISQQAGFWPGKSCTDQILKLVQHTEDGFQSSLMTVAAFVDLSEAYDTVNHRKLLLKLYITRELALTKCTEAILENQ